MGNSAPQRVSRRINGNGPIEDVRSLDIQCGSKSEAGGQGSEPAPLHAAVKAGSTVSLKWTLWPDSHRGPALTYMARCPDSGCNGWLPGAKYAVYGSLRRMGCD